MKILFLSNYYYPHLGGVEKHIFQIKSELAIRGHTVDIITEKHSKELKNKEIINITRIIRFKYPKIKFIGLLYIWYWFIKNRKLIKQSDIVHCHDVFIWYLPLRFLYPHKPVFTTFHGWEGVYPVPLKNIILKKLAAKLSTASICVGSYVEKYYRIKTNKIIYGGVVLPKNKKFKKTNNIMFLGRLEKDTGLLKFLRFLKESGNVNVDFCGDGSLRSECEKYGKVHGFVDPKSFLEKSSICFVSGYLSALEAMAYKCEIKIAWDNPLKKDYWISSPFYKFIKNNNIEASYQFAKSQTWNKVAYEYLELWEQI